ncbi:MAG: DUF1295 domain-containing protein [Bacteroidales bacterium]|nr:DUF1295 domain-containing protein [Bacteroidales bacterium]
MKAKYSRGACITIVALIYAVALFWGVMYASVFGVDLLVLAPVAMTALFLFISIPMMEKRQMRNKPGYAEYRESTRILI